MAVPVRYQAPPVPARHVQLRLSKSLDPVERVQFGSIGKRLSACCTVLCLIAIGYCIRDQHLLDKADFYFTTFFSGHSTSLTKQAANPESGNDSGVVPIQASELFEKNKKGPRADYYLMAQHDSGTNHSAGNHNGGIMMASMTGLAPAASAPYAPEYRPYSATNRSAKGNLLTVSANVSNKAAPEELYAANTPASLMPNTPSTDLFLLSVNGLGGYKAPLPSAVEEAPINTGSVSSEHGTDWKHLLQQARMSPEDATIFGGMTEEEFRNKELNCLATAIYFEARDEPVRGQIAVGQVIMNRVRSPYYPKTICGVVYQGAQNRHSCQFSFACDGKPDRITEKKEWEASIRVAKQVITGKPWIEEVGYATHYHATYVNPQWKHLVRRVAQIGTHIFYVAPFADPRVAYKEEEKL